MNKKFKKMNIVNILMSLFRGIIFSGNRAKINPKSDIYQILKHAGVDKQQMEAILTWLHNFTQVKQLRDETTDYQGVRIFTSKEEKLIPQNCLEFLTARYYDKEINAFELEFVVTQVMLLGQEQISEEQFFWIYDMMLLNQEPFIEEILHNKHLVHASQKVH